MHNTRSGLCLALLFTLVSAGVFAQADLEKAFAQPPADAKPLTWWHWLNGNVSKEGITSDLEAMKRAGLGGCYLFNCGGAMPKGDVRFMQPERRPSGRIAFCTRKNVYGADDPLLPSGLLGPETVRTSQRVAVE